MEAFWLQKLEPEFEKLLYNQIVYDYTLTRLTKLVCFVVGIYKIE